MDRELFRKCVRWFGLVVIAHFVAMIFYGLIFSDGIARMIENGDPKVSGFLFWYNVFFDVLFVALCLKFGLTFDDRAHRNSIKDRIKNGELSAIKCFKEIMLKEYLFKTGVFAAIQLPFLLFVTIWELSLLYPTPFERFYVMDAGSYMLVGIPILGWLLNTVMFAAVFFVMLMLYISIIQKDIKRELMR